MSDANNHPATDPQFLGLIAMWSASALQAMGKLINPATGRTETNLEAARLMIDLLEMLERKTRGNLSDDERRQLRETLTMLRLNYVETASAAPAATAGVGQTAASAGESATSPKGESAPPASGPSETPSASASPAGESAKEDKPPRFHRSYG